MRKECVRSFCTVGFHLQAIWLNTEAFIAEFYLTQHSPLKHSVSLLPDFLLWSLSIRSRLSRRSSTLLLICVNSLLMVCSSSTFTVEWGWWVRKPYSTTRVHFDSCPPVSKDVYKVTERLLFGPMFKVIGKMYNTVGLVCIASNKSDKPDAN